MVLDHLSIATGWEEPTEAPLLLGMGRLTDLTRTMTGIAESLRKQHSLA